MKREANSEEKQMMMEVGQRIQDIRIENEVTGAQLRRCSRTVYGCIEFHENLTRSINI